MPRKNRRDRKLEMPSRSPLRPRSAAPEWGRVPGFDVRHVGGEKPYVCPGCDHEIRRGSWHLVVVPVNEPEGRRHWHTECWRRELRRRGPG